jgi:cytochrome P450
MSLTTLTRPKARPFFGHAPAFSADPVGFLGQCARDHGDLVPLNLAGWPCYAVFHPDLIEQVLTARHREVTRMRSLHSPLLKRIFGNGLNVSEGDFWLRQRRLAQPAFHRERLRVYASVMVEYTERMLGTWHDDALLDVDEEMMRLTLAIATRTLFGEELTEASRAGAALSVLLAEYATQFGSAAFLDRFFITPSAMRARRAIRELDQIIHGLIAQRRSAGPGDDLLSMLLEARDDDGGRMSDVQVRDEVMTFLFGGHETTALSLTWTWHLLTTHPAAAARAVEEVDARLGGRRATHADAAALGFCEQVVKEAMRLYPPIYCMGRETRAPMELLGHAIPAGVQLLLPQCVVQRDPRFFAEPAQFRPERWAPGATEIPRCAYFPFGAGPRICIGAAFSMVEAVLVLATVLQRYTLTAEPGAAVTPWATMTLRPRGGVPVRARVRRSRASLLV